MTMTKKQLRAKIKEVSTWVAAAILGVGVALSISIILMPVGVLLVALAAFAMVTGWLLSLIAPLFFKYREVNCPYCRGISQVREKAPDYMCDDCGRKLLTNQDEHKKFRHLTLIVNKPPKVFGKPGIIVPKDLDVSQK